MIDRNWRFVFKPLLYELLTSEDNIEIIWPRFDELLAGRDVTFVLDEIDNIDLENRQVSTKTGLTYDYRYLVLGVGATSGYFDIPGAKEHTLPFRDGRDTIVLGEHLRKTLQIARQDTSQRSKHLNFVVVGGGPAGVELAVTLGDLLPKWYEPLGGDSAQINVVVMQRGDEILSGIGNEKLKSTAKDAMQKRSVNLMLGAQVTGIEEGAVHYEQYGEQHTMPASTIVWTAGTVPNPLISSLPVSDENRDRRGKLRVLPTLQLPEYPEVFAAGDCALNPGEDLPDTAQVAYQQGSAIARNIAAAIENKAMKPADVSLRGTLLKLGMGESAAEIFDKFEVTGHTGHLIREATYLSILPLPGYKMRKSVQWLADEVFEQFSAVAP